MSSNNNGGHGVAKKIVKVIKINGDKNIKWRCGLKNNLIFLYLLLEVVFYFNSYH